jgi:FixJ family two-component response regulator
MKKELNPLIAVVDDDDSVREATTALLRSNGCRVEAFDSAEAFLASPLAGAAACLLLDVAMPGMSGLELQRTMAAAGRTIPIVFITAHDNPAIRLQALGSGAVDVLPKPFGEAALLRAIKIALAAGKAQAEEEE